MARRYDDMNEAMELHVATFLFRSMTTFTYIP